MRPTVRARRAAMATCHCGSLEAGEKAMPPEGICLSRTRCDWPDAYCQLKGMLDGAYPRGAFNYWKSSFLAELSDDAIDTMIACFARCPTPMG